jgi:RNA polymerase sigma factor (sigma-70 family)
MRTEGNDKGSVIQRYREQLFTFIRGRVQNTEDAEDILQDVWYQFLASADMIEQAGAWLYRVARNKIIDRYRTRHPAPIEIDDEEFIEALITDIHQNPEHMAIRKAFMERLNKLLNELPKEQREVFVWQVMEGRTFREMAAMTGEKIKTLISRKAYAIRHLRNGLSDFAIE